MQESKIYIYFFLQKCISNFGLSLLGVFNLHLISLIARHFYPKLLTLHSRFTFDQFMLSLGIEPMSLALLAPFSAEYIHCCVYKNSLVFLCCTAKQSIDWLNARVSGVIIDVITDVNCTCNCMQVICKYSYTGVCFLFQNKGKKYYRYSN